MSIGVDVQREDRLIDENKLNFKESESEVETGINCKNVSDDEIQEKRKGVSDDKKKRSGKESKLTSDVDFPEIWPHSKRTFCGQR